MIGAADALDEAACPFRGADVDDQIDVAPVDAEVEGRGGDDGLDRAGGHGGLDLAALFGGQRAVVERDRQRGIVDAPEFLENEFGLHARVDEHEREAV